MYLHGFGYFLAITNDKIRKRQIATVFTHKKLNSGIKFVFFLLSTYSLKSEKKHTHMCTPYKTYEISAQLNWF